MSIVSRKDESPGGLSSILLHPIPARPCFACGKPTKETQSIFGVGHLLCYKERARRGVLP
jgi:hypothetical protein